jgi:hypothetical protein
MKDTTKAATPIECVQKNGDVEKTVVWACGSCKTATSTKQNALECCAPDVCEKCGKEIKRHSYCEDCSKKQQFARAQAQYDKAKKVMLSEYAGDWLCCDHCDEYYPDVDSLLDAHDDDEEPPTWAWGTEEQPFKLDAERIISDQLEYQEFYEDAFDNISVDDLREMQNFFDAWLKKQNMKSYMVDNSVVVDFEALTNLRKKELEDAPD